MNWRSIFQRELRQLFITDRRRGGTLFGASLAYLLLFGILYSTHTVTGMPLVIFDEDQTQFSRSLTQDFTDSERFQIVDYVTTQAALEDALHKKTACAAIHIPKEFSKEAKSGHTATVLLMADGSNLILINTITTAAQEIVAAFVRETGARLAETNSMQLPAMAVHRIAPIDCTLRVLNNPTQSYLYFFVLGLAMAAFQQGILMSVGTSIQSEYQHPEELKHAHPLAILTGKLLPYLLSSALAFFVTIAVTVSLFDFPDKATLGSLFCLSEAFIIAAVGLGTLLSSVCNSELTLNRILIAYTVPSFVLSGYTWPREAMDSTTYILSCVIPFSYFANPLRDLLLAGHSPVLYRDSLILLCMGMLFIGIAVPFYNQKMNLWPSHRIKSS
jgi:ABC-2 type transport system permease protein